MRRFGLALAALIMVPTGADAQDKPVATADDPGAMAELEGFLGNGLFAEPEPLTPDQLERLPLALTLAEKVLPEGALGEAMSGMFDHALEPLLGDSAQPDARSVVTQRLGPIHSAPLTDAEALRVANLLDPQWQERERRSRAQVGPAIRRTMTALEPPVRQALAELYAINFSAAELADIDAFFATPSGASYARLSYAMSADTRLTGAMMQVMPQVFAQMATIQQEIDAANADLPPQRNYADLSDSQRKVLARTLEIGEDELPYVLLDASGSVSVDIYAPEP